VGRHSKAAAIIMFMSVSTRDLSHSSANSAASVLPQVAIERNTIEDICKISFTNVSLWGVTSHITDTLNFLSIQSRSTKKY